MDGRESQFIIHLRTHKWQSVVIAIILCLFKVMYHPNNIWAFINLQTEKNFYLCSGKLFKCVSNDKYFLYPGRSLWIWADRWVFTERAAPHHHPVTPAQHHFVTIRDEGVAVVTEKGQRRVDDACTSKK